MSSQTASYTALLFVTSLVLLFWYSSNQEGSKPDSADIGDDTPDFFITDFSIEDFNDQGKVRYSIEAEHLEHYPLSDTAKIRKPFITIYRTTSQMPWYAKADEGLVDNEGKILTLKNQVQLFNTKDHAGRLHLTTQKLIINIENELAYTDEKVTLVSPQGHLEAIGLEADLTSNRLQLKSRVKGKHEPPAI